MRVPLRPVSHKSVGSMRQKWLVLVAVSLIFFFLNGATFASLGVVLFSMIRDLHWSQTAAGASFSLLGIACGVGSPLPALLMKRMGTGSVVVLGGACLAAGFWLAFLASGLPLFYLAVIFLGLGYAWRAADLPDALAGRLSGFRNGRRSSRLPAAAECIHCWYGRFQRDRC